MWEKLKGKLKDRYVILGVLFLIIGLILVITLANLQIVQGKKYDSDSLKRLPNIRTIKAARGNIEDRNGVPIALNRIGYTLQILSAGLDNNKLNEMLLNIVNTLEKNKDTYYKNFKKYLTFKPIGYGSYVKNSKNPVAILKKEFSIKLKDNESLKTAADVFKYLKEKKYAINDKYSDADAYKIMTLRYEIRDYSSNRTTPIAEDISKETVAYIEESHKGFPGVSYDKEPIRKYIDGQDVAHVLGYIGVMRPTQYENYKDKGYGMNDLMGQTGIELAAEGFLRGTDGERSVEVNLEGRLTQELKSSAAVPGDNVILTLDMKLQKIACESLARTINDIKNKKPGVFASKANMGDASTGAVVALDVNSGETLAMASYPTYPPSIFLEGADNIEAQNAIGNLYKDGFDSPEMNRAIAGKYPPGSTFKPAIGIAGIMEGVIDKNTKYNDPGYMVVENNTLYCLEYKNHTKPNGHGSIALPYALATSCNMFFYQLGMDLRIDRIDKWSKNLGLGEKTGIDIPGEKKGERSNKEIHYENYKNTWGKVYTAKTAIGQQYNAFTPIQLANYISTIANGGKRYVPHLIKRVVRPDGTIVKENKPQFTNLNISKEAIEAVKQGMVDVANSSEGTAADVFKDFKISYGKTVAGKTGTAETTDSINGKCSNNGVFICYAPAEKPTIAIAVVIEKGVYGYYAAHVAKDILAEYFNVNDKNNVDDLVKPDTVILTK